MKYASVHAEHVPSVPGVHPVGATLVVPDDTQMPSTGTYPLLHLLQYFEPPRTAVHMPASQFSAYLPVHSGMHVPVLPLSVVRFSTDPE